MGIRLSNQDFIVDSVTTEKAHCPHVNWFLYCDAGKQVEVQEVFVVAENLLKSH